jgi:hypothetical protein
MKINIAKLLTVSNFAVLKGISRQHVYRLTVKEELTIVIIDGINFILLDKKAEDFVKKRR